MKKIYLSTLIIALGLFLSTSNLNAQTSQGAMRIGAQLGYGSGIESLGIGARFDYAITDAILLAPDLMYFFGKSEGSVDLSWFDINLNGNYLFETNNPDIIPYVLAGINIGIFNTSIDDFGFGSYGASGTKIGLNLGGGADFLVGTLVVFGEMRYAISSLDQFVIQGGVKFPLN